MVGFSVCADTPQVALNTSKAGPRSVESLTERAILRDYKFAWANLDQALESNSTAPLSGHPLQHDRDTHRPHHRTTQNTSQHPQLDAVYYSPARDVIDLHGTADYGMQILDGSKTIHSQHVAVRYVVLMTPGADRWVIRQLQAVPEF